MLKFKIRFRKYTSILLCALLCVTAAGLTRPAVVSYAETGTVNASSLNLRSGPGTGYSSLGMLSGSTKVNIVGQKAGNDGYLWYQVTLSDGRSGYLRNDFVNLDVVYGVQDSDFESYLSAQGFPESYKNDLRGLHQKYPNWVFVAQHTGIDWNTAVAEESKIGRNLTEKTSKSSWKSTADGAFDWAANYWPGFDGASWVAASEAIIKHYMDPRNFITDPKIFMFELQSYNPSSQTKEGLISMVKGTFLEGYPNASSFANGASGPGSVSGNGTSVNGTSGSGMTGPGSSSVKSSDGTSVNSGASLSGPGSQNTSSGSSVNAGPGAGTGSGNNSQGTGGPNMNIILTPIAGLSVPGSITAVADWQVQNGSWVYVNSDGTLKKNGWYWLDGNKDGIAECYYFDSDGIMAHDTVINGYTLNSDGAWVDNGKVQRKSTGAASNSKTGTASAGAAADTAGTGSSYVDLIMEAAKQSGVSPYVLAAMIIQEQGKNGTGLTIQGNIKGYEGYYNFYNIAAYEHDGMSATVAGLKYASQTGNGNRPWNTVEKSIVGGAIAYGANYTDNGQDTFYLKKFNVQGSNKYNHQFMTNICAAFDEGVKVGNAYPAEIKNSALIFRIPVYQNMPDAACALPNIDGSPNNKLKSLSAEGFSITPTFNMNTNEYTLIVGEGVSGVNITAQAIDQKARVTGTGYVNLSSGVNEVQVTVTAENGDVRNYRLRITRNGNGQSQGQGAGPGSQNTGPAGSQASPANEQSSDGNFTGPGQGSTSQNSQGPGQGAAVTQNGTGTVSGNVVLISAPPL